MLFILKLKRRAWRPGQTKEVTIHNIYINNTIEERIVEICEEKKEMASSFLNGVEKKNTRLDKATLGKIIGMW
jgi:SNF2 family DNA or RNA helicase